MSIILSLDQLQLKIAMVKMGEIEYQAPLNHFEFCVLIIIYYLSKFLQVGLLDFIKNL